MSKAPSTQVTVKGGRLLKTPRSDMFIVRVGDKAVARRPEDQEASVILKRVGNAMKKPGVRRDLIFRSNTGKVVYAYSMDPDHPEHVVREDEQGNRTIGHFVEGSFRKVSL